MKNILIVIIILIVLINITGCNSMKKNINNNLNIEDSQLEEDDSLTNENDSGTSSSESSINKETIENKNNEEQNLIIKDISDDEFFNLFNMTKLEVIEFLGDNFVILEEALEGRDGGYVYEELGITIYFNENTEVREIACFPNFELLNVNSTMSFSEIQQVLGETEIIELGKEYKSYRLKYEINDCILMFTSFKSDGTYNRLTGLPKEKIN